MGLLPCSHYEDIYPLSCTHARPFRSPLAQETFPARCNSLAEELARSPQERLQTLVVSRTRLHILQVFEMVDSKRIAPGVLVFRMITLPDLFRNHRQHVRARSIPTSFRAGISAGVLLSGTKFLALSTDVFALFRGAVTKLRGIARPPPSLTARLAARARPRTHRCKRSRQPITGAVE